LASKTGYIFNMSKLEQHHLSESILHKLTPLLLNGCFRFRSLQDANHLAEFFAQACPNPHLAIVGISELLINAIEHGNLGIDSEEKAILQHNNNWLSEIERRLALPEYQHKYAEVEFTRTDTEIHLKVTDQGKGFDWQQYHAPTDPFSTHGRGILMAKKLVFKRLEYSGIGNVVTGVIALQA
jgi:hypothetical protein